MCLDTPFQHAQLLTQQRYLQIFLFRSNSDCAQHIKHQRDKTPGTKARADRDEVVKLEIPTDLADRVVEIVLVMQLLEPEPLDEMGYPVGYFEETYGSFADEPLERNQPRQSDVRDEVE